MQFTFLTIAFILLSLQASFLPFADRSLNETLIVYHKNVHKINQSQDGENGFPYHVQVKLFQMRLARANDI